MIKKTFIHSLESGKKTFLENHFKKLFKYYHYLFLVYIMLAKMFGFFLFREEEQHVCNSNI